MMMMMTYQRPGDGRGDGDQQQKRKPKRQQQAKDDADDEPLALDEEALPGRVQREPKRRGGDGDDDDDPIQLVGDGGLLWQPPPLPLPKRTLEPRLI